MSSKIIYTQFQNLVSLSKVYLCPNMYITNTLAQRILKESLCVHRLQAIERIVTFR